MWYLHSILGQQSIPNFDILKSYETFTYQDVFKHFGDWTSYQLITFLLHKEYISVVEAVAQKIEASETIVRKGKLIKINFTKNITITKYKFN